jgi:Family of unknown function (DUF5675)
VELDLWRYSGGEVSTLGLLFETTNTRELICFTCEDAYQVTKIAGRTRIPAGRYEITLRTEGGMHARYSRAFATMHKGMLWIRNVPGFVWVYLHVGNDADDTEGCVLVGMDRDERSRRVLRSREAYRLLYPRIVAAIEAGERVWINVRDLDRIPVPPG